MGLTKKHKEKISVSLKKYYSIPNNKKTLLKNLSKAITFKTKESKTNQGKTFSKNYKKGLIKNRKGVPIPEWHKKKIGLGNKGKVRSKETKEKIRLANLGKKHSKKTKKKMSLAKKGKKFTKEHIKNLLQARYKKPNLYEKKLSQFFIERNLPFIYTGDGTFLIGRKNPDFVDKYNKIAIEVYYSYFKIKVFGSCEEYERQRSKYFAKYGYKTIFIKDNEITSEKWKNICSDKIKSLGNYTIEIK